MAFDKNAKAVEALHKTMVMLREELAKKNQKIKILESRLNHDLEAIEVEKKEEEVKIVVNGNYEYDEKIDDFIDEHIVTEDPVMDFVMSEEEEGNDQNEKNLDSMKISDVKIHTLVVKKDIDVHPIPRFLRNNESHCEGMSFSEIRPILRLPSNSPRSCTGSQTDISALQYQHFYPEKNPGEL